MIGIVEAVNVQRGVFCIRGDGGRYIYFRVDRHDLPAVNDSISYTPPLPEREVPFENVTNGGGVRHARTAIPNLPQTAALILTR